MGGLEYERLKIKLDVQRRSDSLDRKKTYGKYSSSHLRLRSVPHATGGPYSPYKTHDIRTVGHEGTSGN